MSLNPRTCLASLVSLVSKLTILKINPIGLEPPLAQKGEGNNFAFWAKSLIQSPGTFMANLVILASKLTILKINPIAL